MKEEFEEMIEYLNRSIKILREVWQNSEISITNIKEALKDEYQNLKDFVAKKDIDYIISIAKNNGESSIIVGDNEACLVKAISGLIESFKKNSKMADLTKSIKEFTGKLSIIKDRIDYRQPSNTIYGCRTIYSNNRRLYRFDIKNQTYVKTISIPNGSAIFQTEKDVYITGGSDPCSNELRTFNKEISEIPIMKAPMNNPRAYHSIEGISENEFVVIGGSNDKDTLASCELYSTLENKWKPFPPLNKPRSQAGTVLLKDNLYVIKG